MTSFILTDTEFASHAFKFLVQRNQIFENIDFIDCQFIQCDLTESTFQNAHFNNCTFRNCTLNLIKVPGCTFKSTVFENSRIAGVDWSQAHWERKPIFQSLNFKNCLLNHNTFIGLNLKKLVMKNCSAFDTVFEASDLTDSDLRFTDFSKSRFMSTNLTHANLTGAKNYTIAPQHNTLKKTIFSLPEALSLLYALDIELADPEEEST